MNEILILLAVLVVGFSLELVLHTYFIKRHEAGNPVLPRLTNFNITLAHNFEAFFGYLAARLENVRHGRG